MMTSRKLKLETDLVLISMISPCDVKVTVVREVAGSDNSLFYSKLKADIDIRCAADVFGIDLVRHLWHEEVEKRERVVVPAIVCYVPHANGRVSIVYVECLENEEIDRFIRGLGLPFVEETDDEPV